MINKELYDWLEYQWKRSNHAKYRQHFKEWVENITEAQINGFEKMRNTKL